MADGLIQALPSETRIHELVAASDVHTRMDKLIDSNVNLPHDATMTPAPSGPKLEATPEVVKTAIQVGTR